MDMNKYHDQLHEYFNELTHEAVCEPHSNYYTTHKAVYELMNDNLLT